MDFQSGQISSIENVRDLMKTHFTNFHSLETISKEKTLEKIHNAKIQTLYAFLSKNYLPNIKENKAKTRHLNQRQSNFSHPDKLVETNEEIKIQSINDTSQSSFQNDSSYLSPIKYIDLNKKLQMVCVELSKKIHPSVISSY
jgi:hypothetical protein